jgi:hypothetical protein
MISLSLHSHELLINFYIFVNYRKSLRKKLFGKAMARFEA